LKANGYKADMFLNVFKCPFVTDNVACQARNPHSCLTRTSEQFGGICGDHQGWQMVCFQTKNLNLGKFWRALDWKFFINFMSIWNILWRLGIFYDH
jgi:hypothetical protein